MQTPEPSGSEFRRAQRRRALHPRARVPDSRTLGSPPPPSRAGVESGRENQGRGQSSGTLRFLYLPPLAGPFPPGHPALERSPLHCSNISAALRIHPRLPASSLAGGAAAAHDRQSIWAQGGVQRIGFEKGQPENPPTHPPRGCWKMTRERAAAAAASRGVARACLPLQDPVCQAHGSASCHPTSPRRPLLGNQVTNVKPIPEPNSASSTPHPPRRPPAQLRARAPQASCVRFPRGGDAGALAGAAPGAARPLGCAGPGAPRPLR